MDNIEKKIYHVLLSIAYGDSMGMPTENLTPTQIKENFGRVAKLISSSSDGPISRNLPAGLITDDTANSIFLCKMLIDTGGHVNKELFVKYLINWLNNDPNSKAVTGPSTMKAVDEIKSGVPINKAGIHGTTNGAAMKIAPIGLIYSYKDIPALVHNVAEICIPTHNTKIAIQGASIIAAITNYFFCNDIIDWDYLEVLIDNTAVESSQYGEQLPTPDIMRRIRYAINLAKNNSEKVFQDELYSFLGTGLETIEMVPAAVALVYRYKGDTKKCIMTSANIGGDTDTLGAITGAICGSYIFNIDTDAIDLIEKVNNVNFKQIASDLSGIVEGKLANNDNK